MARYHEAVCRLCRRQGEKLFLKGERCLTPKCAVERRGTPPGMRSHRRRKVSERGLQLREKQKARFTYGVLERQFRRHFAEAKHAPGTAGENLLRVLETRLDNVTYRLGFGDSRKQARQIVRHGHIAVNGQRVDIPSCAVKPGDVISWMPQSTKSELFAMMREQVKSKTLSPWLSLDMENMVGRVLRVPQREEIDPRFNEQVIVEYYSR